MKKLLASLILLSMVINILPADSSISDGASIEYIPPAYSLGIGTTSPSEKLTVAGKVSIQETSAPSLTTGYGKVYVDSTTSNLKFLDDAGTNYDLLAPVTSTGSSLGTWDDTIQEDISYKALSDGFISFTVVLKDVSGTSSCVQYVYTDSYKTPSTVRSKFVEIEPNTGDINIEAAGFTGLVPVKAGEYVLIKHTAVYMNYNGHFAWLPIGSTSNLEARASNNLSCSSGSGNYDVESTTSNTSTKTMDWSACEENEFQDNATGAVVRTVNFTNPQRNGTVLLRLVRSAAATSVLYTWDTDIGWSGPNGIPGDVSTELKDTGTYLFQCTYTSTSTPKYACVWQ